MDVLRIHQDELQDDSAFEIASNIKYDGYQRGLALIVYKNIFNKKAKQIGTGIVENPELANKLHKPRKF